MKARASALALVLVKSAGLVLAGFFRAFLGRIIPADECRLTLCEVAVSSRLFVCLLCLFLSALPGRSQTPSQQQGLPPTRDVNPSMTDEDEATARMARDMEKKAAKERVAALKSDTDKLLKLSVELKQCVDKSDENVLSVDVIKKAEEIEKLAHSVKDKMKGPN
jgi:hypothetical protein